MFDCVYVCVNQSADVVTCLIKYIPFTIDSFCIWFCVYKTHNHLKHKRIECEFSVMSIVNQFEAILSFNESVNWIHITKYLLQYSRNTLRTVTFQWNVICCYSYAICCLLFQFCCLVHTIYSFYAIIYVW